jgi:hypothetical protein
MHTHRLWSTIRLGVAIAVASIGNAPRLRAQDTIPPRRGHHALIYDESRQRVLMTGGSTPTDGGRASVFFNDLWEFDGTRWKALPASGDKISGVALAFDSKNNRVVSFGGFNGRPVADVRILEKNIWITRGRNPDMPAAEAGFVYDGVRDRFVAFGGSPGPGQAHSRTWLLNGDAWSEVSGAGPPAREAHVMVFDERRGRVVVFGGLGTGSAGRRPPALGDTWEFDGERWTKCSVDDGPMARSGAGAAYDSRRGRVVIFGGVSDSGFVNDTWAWDGQRWTKLADSGPDARGMGYLAYDKSRDRIVMFGGRKGYPDGDLNDTWEWDGVAWHRRSL